MINSGKVLFLFSPQTCQAYRESSVENGSISHLLLLISVPVGSLMALAHGRTYGQVMFSTNEDKWHHWQTSVKGTANTPVPDNSIHEEKTLLIQINKSHLEKSLTSGASCCSGLNNRCSCSSAGSRRGLTIGSTGTFPGGLVADLTRCPVCFYYFVLFFCIPNVQKWSFPIVAFPNKSIINLKSVNMTWLGVVSKQKEIYRYRRKWL